MSDLDTPRVKLRHVPEALLPHGVTPEDYAAYREFMRSKKRAKGAKYGIEEFGAEFPELLAGARVVASAYQTRAYMAKRGYQSPDEIGKAPRVARVGAGQQAVLDTLTEAGRPLSWSEVLEGARTRCDKSESSLANSLSTHLVKRDVVVRETIEGVSVYRLA